MPNRCSGCPENPLENIQALRRVNFVMKDGAVVKKP